MAYRLRHMTVSSAEPSLQCPTELLIPSPSLTPHTHTLTHTHTHGNSAAASPWPAPGVCGVPGGALFAASARRGRSVSLTEGDDARPAIFSISIVIPEQPVVSSRVYRSQVMDFHHPQSLFNYPRKVNNEEC
uniref:Uncharacterized protein n=1 Tax=Leersia perrieri TaxID=77586 RepID=A0A0D9W959_9ORYZ